MAQAIALSLSSFRISETVRAALVIASAAALIFAGEVLPL